MTISKADIFNLLVTGSTVSPDSVIPLNETVDETLSILKKVSSTNPKLMLEVLKEIVQVKIDSMVMIALAVLTATAPDEFLSKRHVQNSIMDILGIYTPAILLEYVEMLRSKEFGRGFGARPQKWLQKIMLSWQPKTIKTFSENESKEFCVLIRAVHPRYTGERGELVKKALKEDKYGLIC